MSTTDPFNIPLKTIAEKNGVQLQSWGEGTPLAVIPGLEGSGESCLHFIVPAIEEVSRQGSPTQLLLVNYAGEQHDSLKALANTVQELLHQTLDSRELLLFSQSFGNLITARIGNSDQLSIERVCMVSPFKQLPPLLARIAYYSMFVTPTFLYRATIKPMGRYVFGPVGNSYKNHPFFGALTRATSAQVRRQTGWLAGLNYEHLFSELQPELTIILGKKDRLVNIEDEIAFFQQLCSQSNNRKLLLNDNSGHVVLLKNEIKWLKETLLTFLKHQDVVKEH
ncbi:MAG: hypothetical protein FH748_07190 [Balneolaceae bacterium]|nr:hypothetical protein [Balneolaceae bacterium]